MRLSLTTPQNMRPPSMNARPANMPFRHRLSGREHRPDQAGQVLVVSHGILLSALNLDRPRRAASPPAAGRRADQAAPGGESRDLADPPGPGHEAMMPQAQAMPPSRRQAASGRHLREDQASACRVPGSYLRGASRRTGRPARDRPQGPPGRGGRCAVWPRDHRRGRQEPTVGTHPGSATCAIAGPVTGPASPSGWLPASGEASRCRRVWRILPAAGSVFGRLEDALAVRRGQGWEASAGTAAR